MRGLRLSHYPGSSLDKKQGATRWRRRLRQTARKPFREPDAGSQISLRYVGETPSPSRAANAVIDL
jgi:hypothetical protein